jgi:hypothetical protein
MQDVFDRGQAFALSGGKSTGILAALGRRLVDDRVEAKGGNQRDVLLGAMQPQFQDAVNM